MAHCVTPVSYTHLDVYKRQVKVGVQFVADDGKVFADEGACVAYCNGLGIYYSPLSRKEGERATGVTGVIASALAVKIFYPARLSISYKRESGRRQHESRRREPSAVRTAALAV